MGVEFFECAPLTLNDALVIVADWTDTWGSPAAEGFVLRTRPKIMVRRIFVYREQTNVEDLAKPVQEALDVRRYALEWCKDRLNDDLLAAIGDHGASIAVPPSATLTAVALPFLFRRWQSGDPETALRRAASESSSSELKAAVREVHRVRGLQIDVSEFGAPGA